MKINDLTKTVLSLTIIVLVSVGLLAFVDSITKEKIEQNMTADCNLNLESVIPAGMQISKRFDSENLDKIKNDKKIDAIITLVDSESQIVGCVLELRGRGYNGNLQIFCSYDIAGEVLLATLGQNDETAGIGKKAEEDGYMDMFIGSGNSKLVPVSKTMLPSEEANAISGATITFVGVSQVIAYGSELVKGLNLSELGDNNE
ncbi:MAG: FMN-binding protein [Spirochaetales bacterium]|nr:FMN-binding protein [Spirochaetales bacterium]